MKQSESQIIGRKAGQIFQSSIPEHWVLRTSSEEDFGIDYEFEIFTPRPDSKSSEHLNYIDNNKIVSFAFDIDNAKYLIEEVKIPTFLIVCDVIKAHCYWISLKTNQKNLENYYKAIENQQKTLSIHIDTATNFKTDSEQILKELNNSLYIISIKNLENLKFYDYSSHINIIGEDKISEILTTEQEKIELAKLKNIIEKRQFDEFKNKSNNIYESKDKSVWLKINTLLLEEYLYQQTIVRQEHKNAQEFHSQMMEVRINIYEKMHNFTTHLEENNILKILAETYCNINDFAIKSEILLQLNLNLKMHKETPREFGLFWVTQLESGKLTLINEINELYKNIQLQILQIIENNYSIMLIDILPKVISANVNIFVFLKSLNENTIIDNIINFLDNLMIITLNTLINTNIEAKEKWNKYFCLIISMLCYKGIKISKDCDFEKIKLNIKKDIIPLIEKIEDKDIKSEAYQYIEQSLEEQQKSISENEFSIEEEIEFYKQHVKALGVDINNKTDDISQAVKIAIDDLNPERALRNCKYLYLYQSFISPMGQWLQLPTMGPKGLYCTNHKHRIEGYSLDTVHSGYEYSYCNKCTDKSPHPADWKWSRNWQQEQEEKYYKLIFPNSKNK